MTRRGITVVLCTAAILGSALVPVLFGGTHVFESLTSFPPWAATSVAMLVVSSWLAKGIKFRLLTQRIGQPVGLGACTAIALGCDFAFVATPAGLGGYAATLYLCDRIGMTPAAAAALTAADQVLDLLFFTVTVPLAALWLLAHGFSARVDFTGIAILIAAVASTAALLRAVGRRRWRVTGRMIMRLPAVRRRRSMLRRLCADTVSHLRDLRTASPQYLVLVISVTSAQWLTRYAILGAALAGFGHAVPAAAVLLLQSIALHAGQWTGVPGGVGGADLIIAQSLTVWAPAAAIGSAILIWRFATWYLTLLAGGLVFVFLVLLPRDRHAIGTGAASS